MIKNLLQLAGALTCFAALTSSSGVLAAEADEKAAAAELAKKLSNPIASLISVPLQSNFDYGAGPTEDGFQYKLTVQPVIPISLNQEWNVISRTIVPYIYQDDIVGTSSQSGLSDTVQSLFFSPVKPTESGWVWGAGPVFLIPTATNQLLGTEKWGAGPTAVMLRQAHGWTVGLLFNHLWSFAGDSNRADVNATFVQPFVSFTTGTFTTLGLNTESTYDWDQSQWTVPIQGTVSQLLKVGGHPISVLLGYRYYADRPTRGPQWGWRFQVSLLYPKK